MREIHNPGLEMALFLTNEEHRRVRLEQTGMSFDEYRRAIAFALAALDEQALADAIILIQDFIQAYNERRE